MNLDTAKNQVQSMVGKTMTFLYVGLRNQSEEFIGVITKCYPSTFLIETKDHVIKSFSYNDFIIKNLKILS